MTYITAVLLVISLCQVEIPRPDLDPAEPQVATQLKEVAAALESAPDDADAWGRYAITLHAHRYLREADLAYAEAQRLDPEEFQWPYFRSLILAHSDSARSLELLDLAIELDPSYGPARDRRGVVLQGGLGREDEAEKEFREAVRLLPSPSANLHLGQIELKKGNIETAIRHFEAARKRWPESIAVLSSLSQAYARQGDRARARELAEAARRGREMPLIFDARINEIVEADVRLKRYFLQAYGYHKVGQFAKAEAELENGLRIGSDTGRMHGLLARVRLNLGKFERSVESGRLALAAGDNTTELHCTIGHALLRLKQLDEAERSVEAGFALSPADPQVLQLSGLIAATRGDDEEAIKRWSTALEQEDDPATRGFRAQALSRLGRHAEAIDELMALAASQPADLQIQIALGEAHRQAGQLDDALAVFKHAAKDATAALPGRLAAVVLVEQRRFVQAERRLRELRSRWPRDPNATNELAWLLATCPEEAVRDGATALALMEHVVGQTKQQVPGFLDTYASALAENGRFAEATAVMDRVLTLLPDGGWAERRAAYVAHRRAYANRRPWRGQ
jgi:tetratricopeptide (TPR) repeat protein